MPIVVTIVIFPSMLAYQQIKRERGRERIREKGKGKKNKI
jgi:hypothetical protein